MVGGRCGVRIRHHHSFLISSSRSWPEVQVEVTSPQPVSPVAQSAIGRYADHSALSAKPEGAEFLCNVRKQRRSVSVRPETTAAGQTLAVISRWCAVALLLACVIVPRAYADAGVILNESLDTSVARITGSGHSAIYLSRICPADSPVKLRLCRPGEQGSVISNYTTLGEDQPYEWNIVPLSVFLYGVEDPDNRPMIGSQKIKHLLEERYREKFLAGYCDSESCRTSGKAEWREMVGATISRSLYIFVVKTTVEQDEALIAEFNSAPNVNHFNGVTRQLRGFHQARDGFLFSGRGKIGLRE